MKYQKYTVKINREYEEIVENILIAHDIFSYEINDDDIYADNITGEYYDELQPDKADDGWSVISFYEDGSDIDIDSLNESIHNALGADSGFVAIGTELVDDADWRDKWKEYFHGFTVAGIHICPTWEDRDNPEADIEIRIDPGMAFGTGKHESTYMILEHLREYMPPQAATLDVGCGSGILSIAAAKLGAERVCGTDIDRDSISCTYDNLRLNGIIVSGTNAPAAEYSPDGEFLTGDISNDDSLVERLGRGSYDIVFANILADIIIGMTDRLCELVAPSGHIFTSGIIDFKEDEVIAGFSERGFEVTERYEMGEWRAVVFAKAEDKDRAEKVIQGK